VQAGQKLERLALLIFTHAHAALNLFLSRLVDDVRKLVQNLCSNWILDLAVEISLNYFEFVLSYEKVISLATVHPIQIGMCLDERLSEIMSPLNVLMVHV
jgi:hypothetical protein